MTGNGIHTTRKHGYDWGMVYDIDLATLYTMDDFLRYPNLQVASTSQ